MNSVVRVLALLAVTLAAGGMALADTVTMKNGNTFDAKVISRTETQIRIEINGEEETLPVADVVNVETNDKTGPPPVNYDELERQAKEQDQKLTEQTGLQLSQRVAVDELLVFFFSFDEAGTQQAKRTLLEMSKTDSNPYRYLLLRLPEIIPTKLAPLLEVMFEMNPADMREILVQHSSSPSETARAAALRCLTKLKDKSSLELMKRGMADEDPDVRIAAAHGLEALGAKEATPLLLKAMKAGDPRVQNASRDALSILWTEPGQPPLSFLQNSGWDEFWKTKEATVPGAWSTENIEPLVPPGTVYQMD